MTKITLLIYILVSFIQTTSAQNRQAEFDACTTISDARTNADGTIIQTVYGIGSSLLKTDCSGKRIWSVNLPFGAGTRVRIAANGDYIVLAHGQFPALIRISPTGSFISGFYYTYGNTYNRNITGITELPNGNIAICGYNDFYYTSTTIQFQGFLIITDPTGYPLYFKTYGHFNNQPVDDQYLFKDITSIGNKIIVSGDFVSSSGGYRGLVFVTDLGGNNGQAHLTPLLMTYNNSAYNVNHLEHIQEVQGKIYVSGTLGTYNNSFDGAVHLMTGVLDTASFTVQATTIRTPGISKIVQPRFFVRDTTTTFFAFQPLYAPSPVPFTKNIFYGTVTNKNLTQVRKITQTSIFQVRSLTASADTLVFGGEIIHPSQKGYFASFSNAAPDSTLCGVNDTTLQFGNFTFTMVQPSTAPVKRDHNFSDFDTLRPPHNACVYDTHICGDVNCSSVIAAIQPLKSLTACPGDTVKLAAVHCLHSTWFKEEAMVATGVTTLSVTQAGNYYLVADNGICTDTSAIVRVQFYPVPNASITRNGDTLHSSFGTAYQWIDSITGDIQGATGPYYIPHAQGTYSVRVTDTNGCRATAAFVVATGPSGILNTYHQSEVTIYPNPATNRFTIDHQFADPLTVSIYSHDGRLVREFLQGNKHESYNLSGLGLFTGFYVVKISTKGMVMYKKLTVN